LFSFLTLYLFAIFSLSIALGIQIIVLPWLVVDHLLLTSVWVGWVQAAVLIPNLLLLLIGGLTADRGTGARWLVPLLIVNSIIHSVLLLVLNYEWLSISIVCIYSLLLGMTNAFIQPWREYLLKKIQQQELQKTVAKSSLCLYGGQVVGVALSSSMSSIGIEWLLLGQVGAILIAAIAFYCIYRRLLAYRVGNEAVSEGGEDISLEEGFRHVWSIPALRSLMAIVAFSGFFHIGVFIVALPIIVRQVYGESIEFYSGLQIAFVIGTIVATLVVIYRQSLNDPGRRILFSLLYGGVILLALSAKPTLMGLFTLIFLWGLVVGISSNMGRSVLQLLAPESLRGRIISIYQLALFGSAPFGALSAGYAIELWGVLYVLKLSGIISLLAFAVTLTTRSLWELNVAEHS